jgi:3'-phosphoadenosine 5'-phosphosulfate sulfotransferase (PAPS reductase)/FAD synthetase
MDFSSAFSSFDSINVQTISPRYLTDTVDREAKELFDVVVARIKKVVVQRKLRIACSFGKDSNLILSAGLEAHIQAVREGAISADQPFIVSNIDTGVDDIFVRAQIAYEVRELKAYCAQNGVNLVYRSAVPPLRYSWAVMYLSGMKLPSFAKSSADCSVILKVDPAKALESELAELHGDMVTVLGVRSDESARRASSIKRHGLDDVEVFEQTVNGKTVKTFAPIVDIETDDVFAILRRSGTKPIVKTAPQYRIPTYKAHNQLLIKLYGDAQDTCPVSSFQSGVAGAEAKRGSCGTGSRFGCYTCLKVVKDKSADSRQRFAQYDRAGKVKLIRDWMAHNADNMSLRTAVGKSLCDVTGSIVIQENTYNAQTLEKLIYWFAMATREDMLFAENFRVLVDEGRLHEDAGYNEILNDPTIDEEYRDFFLQHYIEMSQEHLIKPLTFDHILMLCAIHARDGVALPPYRALHIWNEVMQGNYIDWPVIVGEPANDPVPEPRFYFGNFKKTFRAGFINPLAMDDLSCSTTAQFSSAGALSYAADIRIGTDVNTKQTSTVVKHAFTRRKIVSKRKSGGITRFEKGRMSVAFPVVPAVSAHVQGMEKPVTVKVPTTVRTLVADLNMWEQDEVDTGFSLNAEPADMFLMTEYDRCLQKHDAFVARSGNVYGGTGPFMHMVNYGVIRMTSRAQIASERMLARTEQLVSAEHGVSLLNMSREELVSYTVDQSEYRTRRAQALLTIRKARNAHRAAVKADAALKQSNLAAYITDKGAALIPSATALLAICLEQKVYLQHILSQAKFTWFDGVHMPTYLQTVNACIAELTNNFGTIGGVLSMLSVDKQYLPARQTGAKVVNQFKAAIGATTFSHGQSMWSMLAASASTGNSDFADDYAKEVLALGITDASKTVYEARKTITVAQMSVFGFKASA